LITAGLGSPNQEGAAMRIVESAKAMKVFERADAVLTDSLGKYAPEINSKYAEYLNSQTKGYGYFAWKPEIVWSALDGSFGDYEGVIWADAGCEVNPNFITRLRMQNFLRIAKNHGGFFYTLNTPENIYTKSWVLRKFGLEPKSEQSPQIQATWFILHGEKGRGIALDWLNSALESIEMLDTSSPIQEEVPEFIEHRFDQSLLSLIVKKYGLRITRYKPAAGNTGLKSQIRALVHPIWIARNRYPDSIIHPGIQKLM
jgi:hypothetical protein